MKKSIAAACSPGHCNVESPVPPSSHLLQSLPVEEEGRLSGLGDCRGLSELEQT